MTELTWHKLNDKVKTQVKGIRPLTFLAGPIYMDPKRICDVIKKYTKDATLLFGILTNKWIPGFEEFPQFASLTSDQLKDSISKTPQNKKLALLNYNFEHTKYIIQELKPDKVIWVNGSWKHVHHYQEEFWAAVNSGIKQEYISPFSSKKEAKERVKNISRNNRKRLETLKDQLNKSKKLSHREILNFAHEVSKSSWDWTGETGAVIVKDNKILSYSHNVVVPYQSSMMHNGSLMEKHHTGLGQGLEYRETNHAEVRSMMQLIETKHSLDGADIYTSKFPCPICARVIADSPINKIYYSHEYLNDISYQLIKETGKEIEAL